MILFVITYTEEKSSPPGWFFDSLHMKSSDFHEDESSRSRAKLLTGPAVKLDFEEIIPLSFISEHLSRDKYSFQIPTLILSFPARRINHAVEMSPQLQEIGFSLYRLFNTHHYFQQKRVLWIASADLAHSHVPWGPYGYNPAANRYDKAIASWVSAATSQRLLESYWSDVEEEQAAGAMSCGFTGFAMIHGALRATKWRSRLYALYVPTYYGMMVASWSTEKKERETGMFPEYERTHT